MFVEKRVKAFVLKKKLFKDVDVNVIEKKITFGTAFLSELG
jgi:hypothetical protein